MVEEARLEQLDAGLSPRSLTLRSEHWSRSSRDDDLECMWRATKPPSPGDINNRSRLSRPAWRITWKRTVARCVAHRA
jgi:hypothetical protein